MISKDKLKHIIKLWEKGYATRDISNITNLTYNIVLYHLKKNNCKPHGYFNNNSSIISNNFTFKNISPEKSFLLGVVFGDGHVSKNRIT